MLIAVVENVPFRKKHTSLKKQNRQLNAAWLAQLVGYQTAVREVEGLSPGLNSLKIN